MTEKDEARAVQAEIEIAAPTDAVWKALTEANELVRWFPREAKVTPGLGGKLWISWGGAWTSEMRIALWEQGSRLRLVERRPRFDASGQPEQGESAEPVELTLDYVLEGRGGSTRLRLVHSGFGRGADWDDEVESTSMGWLYELESLRHYLERHRGSDRHVVWAQSRPGLGVEECWTRLLGPSGLRADGPIDMLGRGERYRLGSAGGDSFEGEVRLNAPPRLFAGTAAAWNDGLLRLAVERLAGEAWTTIWLAAYGIDAQSVAALQVRMDALLAGLFGPRRQG